MRPVLFDTNILSELIRPSANPKVVEFTACTAVSSISVMTLHELTYGMQTIRSLPQRERIGAWLEEIVEQYRHETLPVTPEIAEQAAHYRAQEFLDARVLHVADSLIAATAVVHRLTLVTRNVKDFETLGLELLNPWES